MQVEWTGLHRLFSAAGRRVDRVASFLQCRRKERGQRPPSRSCLLLLPPPSPHITMQVYGDSCLNGLNQISTHYAEGSVTTTTHCLPLPFLGIHMHILSHALSTAFHCLSYYNNTCILANANDTYLGLGTQPGSLGGCVDPVKDLHTYIGHNKVRGPPPARRRGALRLAPSAAPAMPNAPSCSAEEMMQPLSTLPASHLFGRAVVVPLRLQFDSPLISPAAACCVSSFSSAPRPCASSLPSPPRCADPPFESRTDIVLENRRSRGQVYVPGGDAVVKYCGEYTAKAWLAKDLDPGTTITDSSPVTTAQARPPLSAFSSRSRCHSVQSLMPFARGTADRPVGRECPARRPDPGHPAGWAGGQRLRAPRCTADRLLTAHPAPCSSSSSRWPA